MKQEKLSYSPIKKMLIRLVYIIVLLGGVVLIVGFFIFVHYQVNPSISYTLKDIDCSQEAIHNRNSTPNTVHTNACIITIYAINNENRTVNVDYMGIGGGPTSKEPLIRIYSGSNKYCYGGYSELINVDDFGAHEKKSITIVCGQPTRSDPKGTSDANPTKIVIGGRRLTTLFVK